MKNEKKFLNEETKFSGKYNRRLFETLKHSYAPFLKKIFFSIIIGIIGRTFLLFNANMIGYWVDSFCHSESCKKPPSFVTQIVAHWGHKEYMITIFFMCVFGFLCTLIFRVYFSRLSAQAVSRLYDEVTYRTSRFPMSFFDSTPTGRIITRFSSDYGNVFRLFGGPLAEFISIISDLLVMIVLITFASPIYLVLVIFIGFINYGIYRYHRDTLRKERRELSHSRSPSIAHFAETAQGASSIRTYLRQKSFYNRFKKLNTDFLDQKIKTFKLLTFFSIQMNSATALLLLLTGVSAYYLTGWGWLSIGSVGVAFTFITLSGNTVQMFFEWLAQFEEALIGVERLDHYLHLPIEPGLALPLYAEFPTRHWKEKNITSNLQLENPTPYEVDVKNLTFRYRPELPHVLKDINFSLKPGERLGIVGKTGSGKSSLIQALFYLYPVEMGEIRIHGYSPQLKNSDENERFKIPLVQYRKLIALIGQDPTLFRGTLRENLMLSSLTVSQDQIFEVLDKVGLKDWVMTLPKKLDYRIEEKGKNLSHGEKQLFCMARCLLQQSPVIIMDEATSSVDPQSEEIMINATENIFVNRTQLIIAHRLTTLEKCNRILWIDQGHVKMLGTSEEVLPRFTQTHSQELII